MFKFTVETGLFMHIAKSNWSIPAEAKIPLGVAFDNGVRQATGFVAENQHDMIEVHVNEDAVNGISWKISPTLDR